MPVQLVIKAPTQKFDDVLIDCELHWDVLRLKNHLSSLYPTNPKPEEQRLIYAGRLLKDHLTIKDFINYTEGQKYILHLVCTQHALSSPTHSSNVQAASSSSPSSQPSSTLRQRRMSSSPLNDDSSSPSTNGDTSSGQQNLPAGDSLFGLNGPEGGAGQEQMAQQMAAMQQFYAQYMAHFMHQTQYGGFAMPYPSAPPGVQSGANAPPVAEAAAAPPIAGMPVANQGPPNVMNRGQGLGNQNMRMNAQGGPLLDEEEENAENRDWLDWFYIFSRALVLFAILFFYSSLERFMMVTGIAVLIYMYQGGWFGARLPQPVPVAGQQEDRENVPDAQQDNENVQQAQNREPVSSPEVIREPGNEDQADVQNGTDPIEGNRAPYNDGFLPHLIQTVRICLTSFFISLIPEQPPPVNIN